MLILVVVIIFGFFFLLHFLVLEDARRVFDKMFKPNIHALFIWHSMDMMPPSRRNPLGKHVIVGQNGVAAVLDLERRTRKRSQMKKRLKTRRLQVRYMHLKILRRESKGWSGFS